MYQEISTLILNSNLKEDDQGHATSKCCKLLLDHCNHDENLHVTDVECLGNDSDTLISYAHTTVSLLDHIVTTSDDASIVSGIHSCEDCVLSDHMPFCMKLNVAHLQVTEEKSSRSSFCKINQDEIAEN